MASQENAFAKDLRHMRSACRLGHAKNSAFCPSSGCGKSTKLIKFQFTFHLEGVRRNKETAENLPAKLVQILLDYLGLNLHVVFSYFFSQGQMCRSRNKNNAKYYAFAWLRRV